MHRSPRLADFTMYSFRIPKVDTQTEHKGLAVCWPTCAKTAPQGSYQHHRRTKLLFCNSLTSFSVAASLGNLKFQLFMSTQANHLEAHLLILHDTRSKTRSAPPKYFSTTCPPAYDENVAPANVQNSCWATTGEAENSWVW